MGASARTDASKGYHTSTELIRRPSEWYLTGFLVPDRDREPPEDGQAEGDEVAADDANEEQPATKVPKLFPASMGMSVLLPPDATKVVARISFAHYVAERQKEEGKPGGGKKYWRRVPQPAQELPIPLDVEQIRKGFGLPNNPKYTTAPSNRACEWPP